MISGHENNVVNVLTTLDKFVPHVPVYGSAVLFELHRIDNLQDYAVKVKVEFSTVLTQNYYNIKQLLWLVNQIFSCWEVLYRCFVGEA